MRSACRLKRCFQDVSQASTAGIDSLIAGVLVEYRGLYCQTVVVERDIQKDDSQSLGFPPRDAAASCSDIEVQPEYPLREWARC